MNFLYAVLIGAVVGAVVGYLLRSRNSRGLVIGPVAGIVGGLVASVLATLFGDAGYGPKEAILQVVLAAVAADRKSTRLNSSHQHRSRMPSSA